MPAFVPNRRILLALLAAGSLVLVFLTFSSHSASGHRVFPSTIHTVEKDSSRQSYSTPGRAIAPKLGNETAKAELGRAAWKLFHTTFARFPDNPTPDESLALQSYIHLFQRLYPCGECAEHFGQILDEFPPQVSSRSAAAAWGCHVHNQVNKSLKKPLFDCSNIGDFYDCGCADDEEDETASKPRRAKLAAESDDDVDVTISHEDYQRGG